MAALIAVLLASDSPGDSTVTDIVNSLLGMLVTDVNPHLQHKEGKLALHWAAQFAETEVLRQLLIKRPNLAAKDERGNTALHLAAAAKQRFVSCLMQYTFCSSQDLLRSCH